MIGGGPKESLKAFFKQKEFDESDAVSDIDFCQMFSGKFSGLSKKELEQAFNSLNIDMDGFIQLRDLMQVLESYMSTHRKATSIKDLERTIPGFEAMSPRTRSEEVTEYLMIEL